MDQIYDKYGNDQFWQRVMDLFYERNLADSRLSEFFASADVERIKRMNRTFLEASLRASDLHFPVSVKRAHRHLRIFAEDFQVFKENLRKTVLENGVSVGDTEEILSIIETFRADLIKDN